MSLFKVKKASDLPAWVLLSKLQQALMSLDDIINVKELNKKPVGGA